MGLISIYAMYNTHAPRVEFLIDYPDAGWEARVRARRENIHGYRNRESRQPGMDKGFPRQLRQLIGCVNVTHSLLIQIIRDCL